MDFKIPQINSFCCCSLKTATVIIGVTQSALFLLYIISISSYIFRYSNLAKETFTGIIGLLFVEQTSFSIFIFSLILIYGGFKEKSNFVMPWLLYAIASMVDAIINFFWNALEYRFWEFYLEYATVIVLDTLAMYVVFNFYRKIPKNKYVFHYQCSTINV